MKPDTYTPGLKRVLEFAEIEASKNKSGFVDIQSVLIGMLLDGENQGSVILTNAGFTLEKLKKGNIS